MRIALIGMSGTGKSFWSHRLARSGFERLGCDDHIGRALARHLGLAHGSIEAIGQWMGFPYEAGFAERERRYLELEHRVLARFLDTLDGHAVRGTPSFVIDTTGSVIYLDDELLARLCRATIVVYLAAPPEKRQQLLAAYQASPRPVVWQRYYRPKPGEDTATALARSYMELFADRDRRYRQYAHMTVELPEPGASPAGPEALLKPVRAYLDENARAAGA